MTSAAPREGPIAVVGAAGKLGRKVVSRLGERGLALDLPELDIRDAEAVGRAISNARPASVINCAACTDVDGCESNERLAFATNADGARHLAEACKAAAAILVHIPTDFVFDGTACEPYKPGDAPNPRSIYGCSKLAGELAVQSSGCRHLIVRTSWLFGEHGDNFVDAILSAAREGPHTG